MTKPKRTRPLVRGKHNYLVNARGKAPVSDAEKETFFKLVAGGAPLSKACLEAGFGRHALWKFQTRDPDFAARLEEARAMGKLAREINLASLETRTTDAMHDWFDQRTKDGKSTADISELNAAATAISKLRPSGPAVAVQVNNKRIDVRAAAQSILDGMDTSKLEAEILSDD